MPELVDHVECSNCGAPLPIKPGEVIITCEYCGTAHNLRARQALVLRHGLIPPTVTEEERVRKVARGWMRSGFAPPDLAAKAVFVQTSLLFIPFFIFTVHAETEYDGVFSRTGRPEHRSGRLSKDYHWKVLGRRASAFPTKEYDIPLMTKQDYDITRLPKGASVLSAEMDASEAEAVLRREIEALHRQILSEQIDEIRSIRTEVAASEPEFVHAPVWMVRYEYKGKGYDLLVDAAKGEAIKGEVPPPDTSIAGFFSSLKRSVFGD